MSNPSGTTGRPNRAESSSSSHMKRQRSVEWQHEHNYSSSEEENDRIVGRINGETNINQHKNSSNPSPSRDSSSVLAQLIAQTKQLSSNSERSYRSDCDTDDGISVANDCENLGINSTNQLAKSIKNRSSSGRRQTSQYPNENTSRRIQQYSTAQERLRNGDSIFTAGKPAILANNTLIRGSTALNNRRPITSSNSTISSQSTNNETGRGDRKDKTSTIHQQLYSMDSDIDSEPPPEPAPPEMLPPSHRDISMASINAITIKKPSNFVLKIDKNGDQIHEEFIPKGHNEYMIAGHNAGYSTTRSMANGVQDSRQVQNIL